MKSNITNMQSEQIHKNTDSIDMPQTRGFKVSNIFAKGMPHFTLLTVILGCLFLVFYWWASNKQLNELKRQEQRIVDLQVQTISKKILVSLEDLFFLASFSHARDAINSNFDDKTTIENDFVLFSRERRVYDQIRILDTSGKERIRVNYSDGEPLIVSEENLQNKRERYYFYETYQVNDGEYYASPLDLNIEQGKIEQPLKPMIRIGMPLFTNEKERFGIILFNYKAEELLNAFKDLSNQAIGKGMLLNSDGYWLAGPSNDLEWGFMYDTKKELSFANLYQNEWYIINDNSEGQFINKKGMFTYAIIKPFDENVHEDHLKNSQNYSWFTVSHISQEVIDLLLSPLKKNLIFTFIVLSISLLALSMLRARFKILEKTSREAIEKKNFELENTVTELEEALTQIKTLRGIVPICSYCKEIRNDNGYWIKLENYIQKHSHAEFSHSICDKCLDEHFPEEDDDDEDQ